MPITVPTKTDGSIGRPKIDKPGSVLEDLDWQVPAVELERIKTALIDAINGVNAASPVLHNLTASAGPTVNDDSGDGYTTGSLWVWPGTGVWQCMIPAVGAAVWLPFGIAKDAIQQVGASSANGSDDTGFARVDHVHGHGNLAGGSFHAVAINGGAAGFMSAGDKSKLDGIAAGATVGPSPSGTAPLLVGVAAVGSSANYSRGDHTHPYARVSAKQVANFNANSFPSGDTVLVDSATAAAGITITLPAPVSGLRWIFKDVGGNCLTYPLTFVRAGSEKIEGLAASYVYSVDYGALHLVCDGTDWWVL